ncbi:MAG: DNA topoisomerase, partial [Oscillospiraceae bacterium]|nr:DNA topoisomerase [Oscillospiraceae bacterium]
KSYMAQEQTDKALPDLSEGDTLSVMDIAVKEGKTTPPKHFTEDTLLSGMETAGQRDAAPDMRLRTQDDEPERRGLGTPATRAGIIEKLISTGFVERKKSKKTVQLIPARTGISLITVLPEQLQSPLLTAEWEYRLKQVERGELSPETFMGGITEMLRDLVKGYTVIKGAEVLFPSGREVVGKCPRCGGDVTESKKGFFCENNECRFGLWRDNQFLASKKVMLTKQLATAFLRDGRVKLTGLFSEKTGKTYDATVVLEDTGAGLRYKLVFDND